ncbi:MAG TPA: hypothetical protein VFM66_11515, partial [Agromyces sp.]|nr:hypothetical protein [Agromyces sp.]
PGEILVFGLGVVPGPDADASVVRGLAAFDEALAPLKVGEYPNLVERPVDASRFFDAGTWARLRSIKSAYDPRDLVRGNHHVPTATSA